MSKQTAPQAKYSTDWMQTLDGRTAIAQELRQRHSALCNDLGGYDVLSYQERAMIDRCIFLEYHLQQEEMKLATGAEFDSGKWVQSCNALSGLFAKLGLNKRVKEVGTLTQYVRKAG